MTALRDLPQNAPVPTAGLADKAVTSRKQFLDVQWIQGNNNAYVNIAQGGVIQRSPGVPLQIQYTPTVPCWWEVVPRVGIVEVQTLSGTTPFRLDLQARCYRPGPVNAVGMGEHTTMSDAQRAEQNRYVGRTCTALFQIEPGYTWTADIFCVYIEGMTWGYHQLAQYLSLHGKAWAR